MNTFQKTCLVPLAFLLGFYWLHYFAPTSWVTWGWNIESPLWACFIDSNPIFDWFGIFTIPSYIPFLIIILSMLGVVVMYDIEKTVIRLKQTIPFQNNKGVTLVEIMTVIAIVSILAGIAYANIDVKSYRQRAAARELYSNCQYAKMLAIKMNRPVTLAVNSSKYDLWVNNTIHRSNPVTASITLNSSDIPGGNIGAIPDTTPNGFTVPPSCYSIALESCPEFIAYVAMKKAAEEAAAGFNYDHLTTYDPRGIIAAGAGTYNVHMNGFHIPVTIGLAGSITIGNKTTD